MLLELFADSLYWLAVVLAAFAAFVGAMLVFAPQGLHRLTRRLDRWYSLRATLAPLDKPHYIERRFYRHHRLLGAILVVGSSYSLIRLAGVNSGVVTAVLPAHWPEALQLALTQALIFALAAANLFALGCGAVVYFRPSLLKSLEKWSNRWMSTRQALKPLDVPHREVDTYLWHHERGVGLLLLLAGIYVAIMLLAYRSHLL